jgi:hypothetical protein
MKIHFCLDEHPLRRSFLSLLVNKACWSRMFEIDTILVLILKIVSS